METDFELEVIGFETAQLDILLTKDVREQDPADHVPPLNDDVPVTKPGDLWTIGDHRLVCGDSRTSEAFETLMVLEKAHMGFTDPPFNVKVDVHVCGAGKIKHAEFAMASGEMSEEEFIAFLVSAFALMVEFSRDGSLHTFAWIGGTFTNFLPRGAKPSAH